MIYYKGVDLAYYEPRVLWDKLREYDYHYAFIKASQGIVEDPKFREHWTNAKKDGFPRGAYHFWDPRWSISTPEKCAEKFWSLIEDDPGELPMVMDIEEYTEGPYFGSHYWYNYLERLKTLSGGKEQIIYTAKYYWNENLTRPRSVLDTSYFEKYELWVANVNVAIEDGPNLPSTWDKWLFWQYSWKGYNNAIQDELGRPTAFDEDYFNGDGVAFNRRFNIGGTTPPPPPPQGEDMYTGIAKLSATPNVRVREGFTNNTPNPTGLTIGAIQPGQHFTGSEIKSYSDGSLWMHVTSVGGKPINGWSAARFLDYDVTNPPPPPPGEGEYIIHFKDGVQRKFVLEEPNE